MPGSGRIGDVSPVRATVIVRSASPAGFPSMSTVAKDPCASIVVPSSVRSKVSVDPLMVGSDSKGTSGSSQISRTMKLYGSSPVLSSTNVETKPAVDGRVAASKHEVVVTLRHLAGAHRRRKQRKQDRRRRRPRRHASPDPSLRADCMEPLNRCRPLVSAPVRRDRRTAPVPRPSQFSGRAQDECRPLPPEVPLCSVFTSTARRPISTRSRLPSTVSVNRTSGPRTDTPDTWTRASARGSGTSKVT